MENLAKKKKLTIKETLFVKIYLGNFFNAADAARKAGYSCSEKSGYENLLKPHIKEAVKSTIDGFVKKSDDKIASIIKSCQIRAFYDIDDILNKDGLLVKPLAELGDLTQVIDGIEKTPTRYGNKIIYKLADKEKNKELLGKYLSMFSDRLEVTGKDGEPLPGVMIALPAGHFKK